MDIKSNDQVERKISLSCVFSGRFDHDDILVKVAFYGSYLGENFPDRTNTKFIIEAKFDGEQLSTDPVDHNSTIDISQELAWGLEKKSLQLHKLQRSCIKANCYAINQSSKENVGYIVIDIRSAPEAPGVILIYLNKLLIVKIFFCCIKRKQNFFLCYNLFMPN